MNEHQMMPEEPDDIESFEEENRELLGLLERVFSDRQNVARNQSLDVGETPIGKPTETLVDLAPFDVTAPATDESDLATRRPEDLPRTIGRFEIKRILGQGGFGMVFLAHDPRLKRDVALKVPRPEAVMTPELRARFVREAELAAALNHANIVPVFEAGSYGPICYIATAYCDGSHLGQWIRSRSQPLHPNEVARLMVDLAEGIQHAHSRDVIHRDLKPENVLVEETDRSDGAVMLKITDFGLAKSESDRQSITRTGSVVGTPEFMAPEQIDPKLGTVGPAADLYSLGAIAYFMLCGRPPIQGDSLLETIQLVQNQTPRLPSKLRREVPVDLDAICMKCLEKEPEKRYRTASELRADLIHFLNGHPVLARRPSMLDRWLLWCRRRPAVAGLAASLLVVLAVSSIALGALLVRSNHLKNLAESNAKRAAAERDRTREAYFALTSPGALETIGRQRELTVEQREFLENTVAYYRELASTESDDPEDQLWVGRAERRLSRQLELLGEFDESLAAVQRSVSVLQQIPADWQPSVVLKELGQSVHQLAAMLFQRGEVHDARDAAERAVSVSRELVTEHPDDDEARILLARALGDLASYQMHAGQRVESAAVAVEGIALREELVDEHPDHAQMRRQLSTAYLNYANLLAQTNQLDESRNRLLQAREIREDLLAQDPHRPQYQLDLVFVLNNLAGVEFRAGEFSKAADYFEEALPAARALAQNYPLVESYRKWLAGLLVNLAQTRNQLRQFAESESALREMISVAEKAAEDFPDVPAYSIQLGRGYTQLALALAQTGRYEDALTYHDAAVDHLQSLIDEGRFVDRVKGLLQTALELRASTLSTMDRHQEALESWESAIALTGDPVQSQSTRLAMATSRVKLGEITEALEDVDTIVNEQLQRPVGQRYPNVFYNAACVHALVSARLEEPSHAHRAIELLQEAIDSGFSALDHMRNDPELEPLHGYAEFQALLDDCPPAGTFLPAAEGNAP